MKIATVLASSIGALALLAPAAVAQPVTSTNQVQGVEPNTLSVEFLDPENTIDRDQTRAAIGGELGIRIVDATAFAPALGRMEIAIEQGRVLIAYHPAAGTTIERTLALPPRTEDRMALIAFVATNLVRDQASEVIASLPDLPPPANETSPPRVTRTDLEPVRYMPFSIGFVPPLSLDRIRGERVKLGVGISAIAGYADSSQFAAISGVVDIKRNRAGGVQIGGVASIAGDVDGAQIGGVATYSDSTHGVQIGGVASVTKRDVDGLQISGVTSISRGHVDGIQISGVSSSAKTVDGLQLAGVANLANKVDGVQIGGVVNVAGEVDGLQLGVINVAGKVSGVQLGVVNLSDDSDDAIPIGIINYSKNGRLALDAQVDSSRVSSISFRHGSKRVHNIWGLGWSPDHGHILAGAGLGGRGAMTDTVALEVEAMAWMTNIWKGHLGQLNQLRAAVVVPVMPNVEVFGGVAGNVYISNDGMDESANFNPTGERTWDLSDGNKVVLFPSAFAGVRLRAR